MQKLCNIIKMYTIFMFSQEGMLNYNATKTAKQQNSNSLPTKFPNIVGMHLHRVRLRGVLFVNFMVIRSMFKSYL